MGVLRLGPAARDTLVVDPTDMVFMFAEIDFREDGMLL